jgi:GTP-binding protein
MPKSLEINLENLKTKVQPIIEEAEGIFRIEGKQVERMMGYTNLDDENGFVFFQNFMKENGILEKLEELGIEEGDTVCIFNHEFDYLK